MKYTVRYDLPAETELAGIWTATADRGAVTEAAAWLDDRLARAPFRSGEARTSSVHRIAFHQPLGVEFEVIEDNKLVLVGHLRWAWP